ncbi:MAG: hypothetical protein J0H83_17820 [Candidatus Melainabacteria bacterium]|nr:hypothetical protein [Candidatus Melainabacteria bacterium]
MKLVPASRRSKILIALALVLVYGCWISLPHPYIKLCWQYDFPPFSRLGIARYFAASKCLRGKSTAEVKEMLAFGSNYADQEMPEGATKEGELKCLMFNLEYGWSHLYVDVKDDKVIDETLYIH